MERFFFRFKSVLDVKIVKEEIKQKEFSEVERLLRREEELFEFFLSERNACQSSFSSRLADKMSGLELVDYHEYLRALRKAIENQEAKIIFIRQTLEEKREQLIQASKEKKIFENLKERDYGKYLSAVAHEESNFLDDVTMTHYGNGKHHFRMKGGET